MSRVHVVVAALVAAVLLSVTGTTSASALTSADGSTSATITSDQADYAPGSQVVLTGQGWAPGEAVHLDVNDEVGRTWEYAGDVTADGQGAVTDTFTLPDWFVATYRVTATGAVTGVVTTTFTDGNVKLTLTDGNGTPVTPATGAPTAQGSAGSTCSAPSKDVLSAKDGFYQIGSNDGDSVLVTTSATATAAGSTYDFDHWTYQKGSSGAVNTVAGTQTDPLSVCLSQFDTKTNSLVAVYKPRTIATSTTLTTSGTPSAYGDLLTFTATVSSAGGTPPGGTVAFKDGSATISGCGSIAVGSGTATCTIPALDAGTLGVGSHNLSAVYSGSGNYLTSTGTLTQVVNQRPLIGSFTAADKVYDRTTSATITGESLRGGIVGTEDVSLTGGTATFDSAAIGTGKTVTGTGFSLTGANKANYTLASSTLTTTATIAAHGLTVDFTAASKTYDGTRDATITTRKLSGVVSGDTVTVSGGTAAFGTKDVGTGKTVSADHFTLGGADAGNYVVTTVHDASADITPKQVTGSFTAQDKTYDGTRDATIGTRSLTGVVGSDTVALTGGTALFATKDVGTGITVTGTGFGLSGADASNYALSSVGDASATITPKSVTGSFTAGDKSYDGTRDASVLTTSLDGTIQGDAVALEGTAQFDTSHAGTGKTVTFVNGALTGHDAGDYTLGAVSDTTADISPKAITGSFTAADKPYDGTTAATISDRHLDGVVGDDDVRLSGGTATFASRNVGSSITVTGSGFTLSGTSAADYSLASSTPTTTAAITRLALVGHVTVADKTYDGNTGATVTGESVSGMVGGDVVTLTGGTAAFEDRNAGTNKLVTLSGAQLGGADADNYSLQDATPTTHADITPLRISGSFTASSKTYDGTDAASVTARSLTGVLDGDVVTLEGGTATFADKNAGTGKTVTLQGATLTGTDAGNYALTGVSDATADIAPRSLSVEFSTIDKTYDATRSATITGATLIGQVDGDAIGIDTSVATAQFGTKDVGHLKSVTASGFVLTGADKGDYVIGPVVPTQADVTPLSISGSFTADDKVYDGTTTATVHSETPVGVLGDDQVSLTGGSATFADKHAGTHKAVTLDGAALTGADAADYQLSGVDVAHADISAKPVTASFTAADKPYDATSTATVTGSSLHGVLDGDTVTLTYSGATFGTKDAGTGKTVTLNDPALSGASSGDYVLTGQPITATADVTPLGISGSFTASDRVYDGTTQATVLSETAVGVLGNDQVSLTGGTAAFADKNVGTGKTVTLTGATLTGADAGNYQLTGMGTTTADITAKHLTGSFTAADKVYDGTVTATFTCPKLAGVIPGDSVYTTGGTATFADKNVGTGKTVTLTGATLAGVDAGNYVLDSVAPTTASITKATLTVTADNQSMKLGEAPPQLTGTVHWAMPGDSIVVSYSSLGTTSGTGGTYDIVPSLAGTDASVLANYDVTLVKGTLTVYFVWNGFLQPVNDTAHQTGVTESRFKLGQTIPLKFDLASVNGTLVQQAGNPPTFSVGNYRAACDTDAAADTTPAVAADSSPAYTFTSGHYQYNWSTKSAKAGEYRVYATLADGTKPWVDICLR